MTTAEAPPEAVISQPTRVRIFSARREDLRLVMKPIYPVYGAGGMKVGEEVGHTFRFQFGLLHVPSEGTIADEKGRPVPVEEVIPWLDAHPLKDNAFEGFFEMIQAAPPVSADELRGMMRLAAELDLGGLERALKEEQMGWNRPDVVMPLEESITNIRNATAPAEEPKPKPAAKAKPE